MGEVLLAIFAGECMLSDTVKIPNTKENIIPTTMLGNAIRRPSRIINCFICFEVIPMVRNCPYS